MDRTAVLFTLQNLLHSPTAITQMYHEPRDAALHDLDAINNEQHFKNDKTTWVAQV